MSTFVKGGLDTPSSIVANHKDNTLFVTNEGSNTIVKITSSGKTSSSFSSSSSSFFSCYLFNLKESQVSLLEMGDEHIVMALVRVLVSIVLEVSPSIKRQERSMFVTLETS